jgi:acyl-CoA reductase-like NAD-dependent aldehyde dehydrogenase
LTACTDGPQLFIAGEFRPAAQSVPLVEAATGEWLGDGPCATESDIDDAVAGAHGAAAQRWRPSEPDERAEVMKRFAAALRAERFPPNRWGRRLAGKRGRTT